MLRAIGAVLWIFLGLNLIAFGGWYALTQKHKALQKEVEKKTRQVEEMLKAQKQWNRLKEESERMKSLAADMERRIPQGAADSYEVIRNLAVLILRHPVRVEGFKHKSRSKQNGADGGGESDARGGAEAKRPTGTASGASQETNREDVKIVLKSIPVTVKIAAEFPTVLEVLDEIMRQERLFLIKSLKITRDAKSVPYQKVEMTVETYSFE